ncbi:alkaline phosphatase family protein [bacterium]|nr:alkaline phosphatase family protein [bacterium]
MRILMLTCMLSVVSFTVKAQNDLLQSGPMLGYSEKREVMVWVQTRKSAKVQIRYWDKSQISRDRPVSKISKTTDAIVTVKENDFIAHIAVGDLEPGTKYDYEVLINKDPTDHNYPFTFQTQSLWEWRTDPQDFYAAFGSCLYVNEPIYDRPGTPYGSHYEILEAIADKNPDIMLWLGDNTYLRETDWNSWSGILHRNRHTRALPELKRLLSSTHHYAIWDDHDYGYNNCDRTYPHKYKTLEAFKLYWGNPNYGSPSTPGVFFQFRWSDADFFMLDDRFYRSPDKAEDDGAKTMLGNEQLAWLKDCLLSSEATFKVVVCGNQVLNENTTYESYNFYKKERADILNFIKNNNISGVLFLSGDVHHTELLKTELPDFYTLYDFTSSPFTSGLSAPNKLSNPQLVPNTLVTDFHNFGMLRFSGKRNDRKLTMETFDSNGKLIWTYTIHEKELKPKNK